MGAALSCFHPRPPCPEKPPSDHLPTGEGRGSDSHQPPSHGPEAHSPAGAKEKETETEAEAAAAEAAQQLSPSEMDAATNHYSQKNLLGSGTTGDVFRGVIGGRPVAVKRMQSTSITSTEFLDEVSFMRMLDHDNIVRLIAYSQEGHNRALAFEFAPHGSLYSCLFSSQSQQQQHQQQQARPVLTWAQRCRAVLGAAQGLSYLHHTLVVEGVQGMTHKRVNCSNILLFDEFVGKLADCRLQSPEEDSLLPGGSLPLGNYECEAPEVFLRGTFTTKTDVYSFGMVLLETLSGRKATQSVSVPAANGGGGNPRQRQLSLKEWFKNNTSPKNLRQFLDERLAADAVTDKSLKTYCKLINLCTSIEPNLRPDMRVVVRNLQHLEG